MFKKLISHLQQSGIVALEAHHATDAEGADWQHRQHPPEELQVRDLLSDAVRGAGVADKNDVDGFRKRLSYIPVIPVN